MTELLVKDLLPDLEQAQDVPARIKAVQEQVRAWEQFYRPGQMYSIGTVSSWVTTSDSTQALFNQEALRLANRQSQLQQAQLGAGFGTLGQSGLSQSSQNASGFTQGLNTLGQMLGFGRKP